MTLMSLAIGSSFVTECYGGKDKYANKSEKLEKSKPEKLDTMKCLEKQIHKIKRAFQKNHNKQEALEKLRALEPKIKALIARLKKSEQHGKMWEVHEHTLNRQLRDVRKFVEEYTELKDKEVKVQSKTSSQAFA